MDKFNILLNKIKITPELYLGEPSLKLLSAFIGGYVFCEQNENKKIEEDSFYGFNEFITKKYGIVNTTHYWSSIIRFFSSSDRDAFYQFYKDYEEFSKLSRKEKQDIIKKVEEARFI